MLVLSRKKNESIVINNDIVVTVVEIRGDKVRLGIVAPKEVPVHRQKFTTPFTASRMLNLLRRPWLRSRLSKATRTRFRPHHLQPSSPWRPRAR